MESGSGTLEEAAGTCLNRTEHRRHRRFPCEGYAEAVVSDAEFLFCGEVKDISLAGCYLCTRARLRLHRGAEVALSFNLMGVQVKCMARVASLRPGKGVGFQFLVLDPRTEKSVRSIVRQFEETTPPATEEK